MEHEVIGRPKANRYRRPGNRAVVENGLDAAVHCVELIQPVAQGRGADGFEPLPNRLVGPVEIGSYAEADFAEKFLIHFFTTFLKYNVRYAVFLRMPNIKKAPFAGAFWFSGFKRFHFRLFMYGYPLPSCPLTPIYESHS
ncbi:hypothetical protein SDC9_162963 [bioreactor metagenome]|uniref:Uncharacterized protein n=1 Tax=bioreactor metagenome TaxID=1076179 RepID=A0A645FQH1_9ZZZZ